MHVARATNIAQINLHSGHQMTYKWWNFLESSSQLKIFTIYLIEHFEIDSVQVSRSKRRLKFRLNFHAKVLLKLFFGFRLRNQRYLRAQDISCFKLKNVNLKYTVYHLPQGVSTGLE